MGQNMEKMGDIWETWIISKNILKSRIVPSEILSENLLCALG